ncbi:MAG: BamA/TamA family outer membrane protein [Ignavibacteria bacterium]|nr:BamA/TamA family outer membrane protein [Ignavibacteria bacterium]MBT8381501.1 BamA/TamA family outer membrane protein [Ignavibacteria bacterium]MBT8391563.1 BamA/TamA family outer membrane protein [Ignavibacteria bacterium]NNJ52255.1 BamA/TamA family outer membrane protein [Ignavibacteriaceae bacterium]NNL22732.1 BamA/TamA family outer membrane protein [Ignavibacteriaceae bacterium]
MILIKQILLVCFAAIGQIVFAQTLREITLETKPVKNPFGIEIQIPTGEPLVGIALSGGGARGFSQIGVLKALEDENITIGAIAGTSIGSIVGGLYASGYSISDLDSIVKNTNWDGLLSLSGSTVRRELFIDQKIAEDRSIFTVRLEGFRPVIPTSFNEGLKLSNYLTLLSLNAPISARKNFDSLLISYRAVCTDLINGKTVILKSGPIGKVMRASSSVTFFLAPVQIDSLTLVDGGLVSNIPVSAVKNLSPDFVIAVNTTSPLREQDDLSVPWNIADQTVSIPMKQLEEIQLTDADLVIQPNLQTWSAANFSRADSIIDIGYYSTLPFIEELKSRLDSLFKNNLQDEKFFIKNVKLPTSPEDFEIKYHQKYADQDSVSSYEISADMAEIFKSGNFKSIKTEIVEENNFSTIDFQYELNPVINSVFLNIDKSVSDTTDAPFLHKIINELGKGKPFNGKKITATIIKIIKHYKKKGFLLFDFERYSFSELDGTLELSFRAGRVKEIIVHDEATKTIVKRELNINEGDIFLYKDVESGLNNLRSTGLFDETNLEIKKLDETNAISVNVSVKKKISSLLKVGFLVDNVYNAQIGLDLRDVNVFESGTELGLFLFGGASNRAYILEHIAHRILTSNLTYKLSAFYKFNDIKVYSQENSQSGKTFQSNEVGKYRQIFYGMSLSIGTQLEKFGRLIFTGKYQLDEVKNKQEAPATPYKTKIVGLRISGTIDSQNKYPYPEDGLYFDGYYETAQSFLGGDEGYLVVSADLKYYLTLASHHVISPRVQIGFGDKTLPLSEQFLLGGQYSFFGAHEHEYRGRQIFLASIMYQYKFPFKIFFDTYFWFRYDLGSTWIVQEEIRFKDLKHGIGGTLGFDTPIGPMDFSIGRSFIISKGLKEGSFVWGDVLFYFSIGHAVSF